MSEDLYNQAILEAAKSTAHAGRLEQPSGSATVDNPLCGDRVTLDLRASDGRITEIAHKSRGCLLTRAAASLLATRGHGLSIADAGRWQDAVRAYLEGRSEAPPFPELAIMAPVKAMKSRHDCVTIAFDALARAVAEAEEKNA